MVWYFIGVYIINRTLHGRLEIRNFSSRVEKIFHSFAALTREIFFNTRREISYLRAAMQYPLFLFQCPTYFMIRNKFYYKVKTLIPNSTQLPIYGLINELMNSSNYSINIQFVKYISACFDVRDKLLSKQRNGPMMKI